MTRTSHFTALCSALPIAADGVPEWVQLLPAGGTVETVDGRGPYRVKSMHAVAAASLQAGDKLPIDECHSTDLAAPKGEPAPARGWIVELQARDGGLWGRVEWTGEGRRLMEDKAYRGISPAIRRTRGNDVLAVLRASLTNTPNLKHLVSLHAEESGMDLTAKLIELLKLDGEADEAAIIAALKAKLEAGDKPGEGEAPELQSAAILDLQSRLDQATGQLESANGRIDELQSVMKRRDATAFVDAEIRKGRIGLTPVRDDYIDMHMADPAKAVKLIGAMQIMPGRVVHEGPLDAPDAVATDPVLLAAEAGQYQQRLADSGQQIDFASAVMAVSEGRHK